MKIVVAGGSGFVGSALVEHLLSRGEVAVLSRNPSKVEWGRGVAWHPPAAGAWEVEIATADAVINLAGASIAGERWNEERKRVLVESRVESTRALARALRASPRKDRLFISVSGVDIYPDSGDQVLDERSHTGSGFLADLGRSWEAAAHEANEAARVVIGRMGIVLHPSGGALQKLLIPFRAGAGGPLGDGSQWMSWIAREDAVRVFAWMIGSPTAAGVYNIAAPEPVTNEEFARALAGVLHRPSIMKVPAFALRAAVGEIADEALLTSQRVVPSRLLEEGFEFQHPELKGALAHMLA